MEPETTALITDPMGVFGFLAAIVAGVFWVSELPRCKKLFEVVPPVIYVYFLPMLATTAGITPSRRRSTTGRSRTSSSSRSSC